MGRTRLGCYALLMSFLLVTPRVASSIELRWSDGSLARSFTEATRCTLEVRADSTEQQLPAEWRLLWVADTSTIISPIPLSTSLDCEADVAKVQWLDAPANAADSAAHLLTAHFCSTGESAATLARYALDLGTGSSGKLKVVALDPDDSTSVLTSNEVTFNGGAPGDFAPTLLAAFSVHRSLRFEVTAIGANLGGVQEISVSASDGSWTVPLSIAASSGNSLTATAALAALVPDCVVSLGSSGATDSPGVPLAGDAEPALPQAGGCASYFREDLLAPARGLVEEIQPKDFAFVKGFVDTTVNEYMLHLFYTRQNQELSNNHLDELTTRNLGHAVSGDFSWSSAPDTSLLTVRLGHFDNAHVWAPTVVLQFPNYYMFYVGVDSLGHQRIGVATSRTLQGDSWVRADTAVFDVTKSNWAARGSYMSWVHCRDPFVMQDPEDPHVWLMYYVAVDSGSVSVGHPHMAVGVARSYGDMYSWTDSTVLASTMRPVFGNPSTVVESPHLFRRNGRWWLPYTVNADSVYFESTDQGPVAPPTQWSDPVCLRSVVQGHPATQRYFHASEYLEVNGHEYLAAYDDAGMQIDIQQILPLDPDSVGVDSLNLGCPQGVAAVSNSGTPTTIQFLVSSPSRSSTVSMHIELPQPERAKLTVYDLLGRRCRSLVDGDLPAGSTHITWDCRDQDARHLPSGVYFVRLTCSGKPVTRRTIVVW
jgi:hypothetical protein